MIVSLFISLLNPKNLDSNFFFLSFLLRFHLLTSVDRRIYGRQRRRERADETLESSYDEKQVGKMFFINNTVESPLGVQP